MNRLFGLEKYGADDPDYLKVWCGHEVTVDHVERHTDWMVYIEEDDNACFFMEEIECIIEEMEIPESDESIDVLFGGVM